MRVRALEAGRTDTIYFDAADGAKHYAEVLLRRRRKRGYAQVTDCDAEQRWKLLELEAGLELRLHKVRRQLSTTREQLRTRAAAGEREQLVLWDEDAEEHIRAAS